MLLSMTGFGQARSAPDAAPVVRVEVRSVNNRHLKVVVRGSDPYPLREADVEKIVRRTVRRGTLHVDIRVERGAAEAGRSIDAGVLRHYLEQLRRVCRDLESPEIWPNLAAAAVALPGVAGESTPVAAGDDEWPAVERALTEALAQLESARRTEGDAMAAELARHHRDLADRLAAIAHELPRVADAYRARLFERVRATLASAGVTLEPGQLVREVALYAERTDVAEEVHRLGEHLNQFADLVLTGPEGAGRRFEFLTQEIGREVNTLGSKVGEVELSRQVFELKATLEKVRELVQNLE